MAKDERLPGERHFWALFAKPSIYPVEMAFQDHKSARWSIKRSQPRAGDRAVIWRGLGRDGKRGVVALGEFLSDPAPDSDRDARGEHWRGELTGDVEAFAEVRYVHPPKMPLWIGESADWVLRQLSVSTGQGTIFKVTPEQWEAVVEAAGGWPEDDPEIADVEDYIQEAAGGTSRRGQGFRVSASARRAVEERAMEHAMAHYRSEGWLVQDVSATESYDLLCTRPGQRALHVEVKGTSGDGSAVLLTPNEVQHALERYPDVALYVVASITVDESNDSAVVAVGGEPQVYEPWNVSDGTLKPLGYSYRPRR